MNTIKGLKFEPGYMELTQKNIGNIILKAYQLIEDENFNWDAFLENILR